MNKRILIPSAALILIAAYLLTNCRSSKNAFSNQSAPGKSSVSGESGKENDSKKTQDGNSSDSQNVAQPAPTGSIDFSKRKPEIRSLHIMTNLLAQALQPGFTLDEVVRTLKTNDQDPKVTSDKNGVTGEMVLVRTGNPYPGTRYFQAQYFSNGDGTHFVQHMSFEFRPGPNAMKEAIESIKTNFPGLGKPLFDEADTIRWELPGGYMIEATRLDANDIKQPNPYNTYDAADVGTIAIILQLDEDNHDEEDGE